MAQTPPGFHLKEIGIEDNSPWEMTSCPAAVWAGRQQDSNGDEEENE